MLSEDQIERIITDLRVDKSIIPAADFAKILQHTWGFSYNDPHNLRDDILLLIRTLFAEYEMSVIKGNGQTAQLWSAPPAEIVAELGSASHLDRLADGTFVEKGWRDVDFTFGRLEWN